LKLESERKPADEASYVYYTIRMDMKVENPEAVVVLHDLTHG